MRSERRERWTLGKRLSFRRRNMESAHVGRSISNTKEVMTMLFTLKRALATGVLALSATALSFAPHAFGFGVGFEPPALPEGTHLQGPSIIGDLVWALSSTGGPDTLVLSGGKCANKTIADWNLNPVGTITSNAAAFAAASGKDIEAFLEGTCQGCNPIQFNLSDTPADVQACYAGKPNVLLVVVTGAQTQIKSSTSWTGNVHLMAATP